MEVFIEFFSDEALENVMTLLAYKPGKIIFLGHKYLMITKKINSLRRFAERISPETELDFIEVPRDDLDSIIKTLSKIADDYPEARYELTGGSELILMAFGYISATKNLNNLRIDPFSNFELEMKGGNVSKKFNRLQMTVEDDIVLHGGSLAEETGSFSTWRFTDEFLADIRSIWKCAAELKHKWNLYCSNVENCIKRFPGDEAGLFRIPKSALGSSVELFRIMNNIHMIHDYHENGKSIRFYFKNEMIKNILTKTGNILELHVYEVATRSVTFNDAVIGAVIDWGNESETHVPYQHGGTPDTINEIDVILMRGLIPTFISCKSGKASSLALHELQTITHRFGGNYAKKALVLANPCDTNSSGSSFFKQRAKEMHIWVIDNVYNMTDEELLSRLNRIQNP